MDHPIASVERWQSEYLNPNPSLSAHLAKLPRASETAHRGYNQTRRQGRLRPTESAQMDLRHLLGELALALLPCGITPNKLSKLARDAFVRAAASKSLLKNGKVNRSKVAALTGLPRKEIKRILNQATATKEPSRTTRAPSERVVQGWLTDRRFLTQDGHPKSLAIGGAKSSFKRLVKDHGGDISPRAVLDELTRSRSVVCADGRLKLQISKLPISRTGLATLTRIIPTLVDGLRVASRQPANAIDSVLFRLTLHASSAAELTLIRERCSSSVHSLLHGLSESLERQLTIPVRRRSSRHTLTITVLLAEGGTDDAPREIDSKR